jgi:DNA-binding transcriptional regulator GbsR (MarR family)
MIATRESRTVKVSAAQQHFIDELAHMYARYGVSMTFGRLFGLLLVSERPLGLDDITELLSISKSGASVAARELERAGVVRRLATPGSRRIVYQASEDMEPMFTAQFARIRDALGVVAKGESILPSGPARQRMRQMKDLHEFWLQESATILERWRRRRQSK